MEKQLICSLLRVFHSENEKFSYSKVLDTFIDTYNIGVKKGKSFFFTSNDKHEIAEILIKSEGVNAKETTADSWLNLSRVESTIISSNEKMTSENVRKHRVAVKTLPGRPLLISQNSIYLPNGANIDISSFELASTCQHKTILVIENWETFENIHKNRFSLDDAGSNPLVVFRGSPIYTIDNTNYLLKQLKLPVFAYVDYDPKGLCIALELPYFERIIVPPDEMFIAALKQDKNQARFKKQLLGCQKKLSQTDNHQISSLWKIIELKGNALPQEHFQSG